MVKVLGHRGVREQPQVDENSLQAFEAAFAAADGIETDGIVSKKGTVFLGHDTTQKGIPHLFAHSLYVLNDLLDKASAAVVGKRHIEDLTDEEIGKLRLKKGGSMPCLAELFNDVARHPGKTLNIEVKGEKAIGPIIDDINKAVAAGLVTKDQIILTSFNHPAIRKAKELAPDIRRGLIFSSLSQFDSRIYPWSGNKESRYINFNEKALTAKLTHDAAPDFFVMRDSAVTAKNVSLLRKHFPQGKIMFWTSNEKPPQENARLLKVLTDPRTAPAIEAVITNYPGQVTQLLKAKGLKA